MYKTTVGRSEISKMNVQNNITAIKDVSAQKETCWVNPYRLPFEMTDALCSLVVSDDDIEDAEKRLLKFAPFIMESFPEAKKNAGIIESPLVEIENMKNALEKEYGSKIPGRLYLKMDSHLDVAGSVKARGGIYEVLCYAERLALEYGKISPEDNYIKFASREMKDFFSGFTVQVGSTGNLGMSIGIMSAALGFRVKIHMSADAKAWKKDLLRKRGVEVIEYSDDYSRAVAEGRKQSALDKNSYFVDDEKSVDLFVGYATAAKRLAGQLRDIGIKVDSENPLIVYIPAGVGGAPGGICYGLRRVFGDNVHCFFAEPVLCPSVLLGIATGKAEKANVRDYGISSNTEADGLACASPSGFVCRIMTNHVSGDFTVCDRKLYDYLRLLDSTQNIRIEPSSCAAFEGPTRLLSYDSCNKYLEENGITDAALQKATHIVWATGGKFIPEEIYGEYLKTYIE